MYYVRYGLLPCVLWPYGAFCSNSPQPQLMSTLGQDAGTKTSLPVNIFVGSRALGWGACLRHSPVFWSGPARTKYSHSPHFLSGLIYHLITKSIAELLLSWAFSYSSYPQRLVILLNRRRAGKLWAGMANVWFGDCRVACLARSSQ